MPQTGTPDFISEADAPDFIPDEPQPSLQPPPGPPRSFGSYAAENLGNDAQGIGSGLWKFAKGLPQMAMKPIQRPAEFIGRQISNYESSGKFRPGFQETLEAVPAVGEVMDHLRGVGKQATRTAEDFRRGDYAGAGVGAAQTGLAAFPLTAGAVEPGERMGLTGDAEAAGDLIGQLGAIGIGEQFSPGSTSRAVGPRVAEAGRAVGRNVRGTLANTSMKPNVMDTAVMTTAAMVPPLKPAAAAYGAYRVGRNVRQGYRNFKVGEGAAEAPKGGSFATERGIETVPGDAAATAAKLRMMRAAQEAGGGAPQYQPAGPMTGESLPAARQAAAMKPIAQDVGPQRPMGLTPPPPPPMEMPPPGNSTGFQPQMPSGPVNANVGPAPPPVPPPPPTSTGFQPAVPSGPVNANVGTAPPPPPPPASSTGFQPMTPSGPVSGVNFQVGAPELPAPPAAAAPPQASSLGPVPPGPPKGAQVPPGSSKWLDRDWGRDLKAHPAMQEPYGASAVKAEAPAVKPPVAAAAPVGVQTAELEGGFTAQSNPSTGTLSIKGPNGEKLAARVYPDHIEFLSIGRGKAPSAKAVIEAFKKYAEQQGKPIFSTSTNLSESGGTFRAGQIQKGHVEPGTTPTGKPGYKWTTKKKKD